MSRRVLILSSEFPPGPGGIGQHAYSLAKALHSEGYHIRVLSPADYATNEEVATFDQSQLFEIERYPRRGRLATYPYRLLMTLWAMRSSAVSVVILTGKFSLWQGLLIRGIYPKIRTLAVLHGSEVNLANYFLRWLTHRAIAAADVIIPVSQFTRSLLPGWIQRRHQRIQVIPNGIDQAPSSAEGSTHTALNGTPCLLTVGHVSPRKGQHRVIKALPRLIEAWPDVHYHIVGRPKTQMALEALADQLGVRNHITFHGRVPAHQALGSYYRQADVFMLLSENQPDGDVEGFGIVALEANLHGVPVVGAKYCGVEEAVDHMRSGYVVDGDKPDEIVEGINYCMANKASLQEGADLWVHAHQWTAIVKQYNALLG